MRCNASQKMIFEYLYDLLEDVDREHLEEHLEQCDPCRLALASAKGQQQLLATAAKVSFPKIVFTRPESVPPVVPSPSISEEPRRRRGSWTRWAILASLLLVVGTMGAWGVQIVRAYSQAENFVAGRETQIARAEANLAQLEDLIQQQETEKQQKVRQVERELEELTSDLEVLGPKQITSGDKLKYTVRAQTRQSDELAEVEAKLHINEEKQTRQLVALKKQTEKDAFKFQVPNRELSRDAYLELTARDKAGQTVWSVEKQLELRPNSYRTYLTIDRPLYRPGDVLNFRSLTLESATLRPPVEGMELQFFLAMPNEEEQLLVMGEDKLTQANGVPIEGPDNKPVRGIATGNYPLSPDLADGDYQLIVRETQGRFKEQRRSFRVQRYPRPQLEQLLQFSQSTYDAGEEVNVLARAVRPTSGPVRNRPVSVRVNVDGTYYDRFGRESEEPLFYETDGQGEVPIRFKLPENIERGYASLCLSVDNGGKDATVVCPIPLKKTSLELAFFPEGGELIGHLPARVYFQAQTATGEAIAVRGQLLANGKPLGVSVTNDDGERSESFQGRGVFRFVPLAGVNYQVEIESPPECRGRWSLPEVQREGVVLAVDKGVSQHEDPIAFRVFTSVPRPLVGVLTCRDTVLDVVAFKAGTMAEGVLRPRSSVAGICRLTIYERVGVAKASQLVPRAERLVYRRPQELDLSLACEPHCRTNSRVEIGVQAKVKDTPAPAILLFSVTDNWYNKLGNTERPPSMPAFFFLDEQLDCPEALERADVLLRSNPHAEKALDRFLAVHGWRRFIEESAEDEETEQAPEILYSANTQKPSREWQEKKSEEITNSYRVKLEELYRDFAKANEKLEQTDDAEYRAALLKLGNYRSTWNRVRTTGLPILAALVLVGICLCVLLTLHRNKVGASLLALPTACASFLLLAFLVVGHYELDAPESNEKSQVALHLEEADESESLEIQPEDTLAKEFAKQPAKGDVGRKLRQVGEVSEGEGLGAFAGRGGATGNIPSNGNSEPKKRKRSNTKELATLKGNNRGSTQHPFSYTEEPALSAPASFAKQLQQVATRSERQRGGDKNGLKRPLYLNTELDEDFHTSYRRKHSGLLFDRETRQKYEENLDGWQRLYLGKSVPRFVVREYADARLTSGASADTRTNGSGTVYWHPVLVLPKTGETKVRFGLGDVETSYEATVIGHTLDGKIGVQRATFEAKSK